MIDLDSIDIDGDDKGDSGFQQVGGMSNPVVKKPSAKTPKAPRTPKSVSNADGKVNIADLVAPLVGDDDAPVSKSRPGGGRRRSAKTSKVAAVMRPNGMEYLPRKLSEMTDIEVFRVNRLSNRPFLLAGPPGCGKTVSIEAAFGEDLITVGARGYMQEADLLGAYKPRPNNEFEWQDGPLVRAMKEGKVLLADDITLWPPEVLDCLYPAMDDRREFMLTAHDNEIITAQEGFMVVGAYNPNARGGEVPEALGSRFSLVVEFDTDLDMAVTLGVPKLLTKVVKNLITKKEQLNPDLWIPQMREMLAFKSIAEDFSLSMAATNLVGKAPEEYRFEIHEALKDVFDDVKIGLKVGKAAS